MLDRAVFSFADDGATQLDSIAESEWRWKIEDVLTAFDKKTKRKATYAVVFM